MSTGTTPQRALWGLTFEERDVTMPECRGEAGVGGQGDAATGTRSLGTSWGGNRKFSENKLTLSLATKFSQKQRSLSMHEMRLSPWF